MLCGGRLQIKTGSSAVSVAFTIITQLQLAQVKAERFHSRYQQRFISKVSSDFAEALFPVTHTDTACDVWSQLLRNFDLMF